MGNYSMEEIISASAFISVFSLLKLPYEKIDGNLVPTIIFKNKPSYFHTFVLMLNFAFCGGVMAIFLRYLYPKIASLCRFVSLSSMVVAMGIFIGLAVPWAMGALFNNNAFLATVTATTIATA